MVEENLMDGGNMGELRKVIACIRELDKKMKVDNFQDKLVIQKTVCLLELLGFDMKYGFSMYVRGPYSPALTEDLYQNKEAVENLRTDYVPSGKEKSMISVIGEASNHFEPSMLEIMATYAFLIKRSSYGGKEAITELKRIKPFYSETKIAVGVSRAKQLFPATEKEVRDMKAEFKEIEAASTSDNKY